MMQNVLTDRTLTFKKNKILGLYRLAQSLEILKQSKKRFISPMAVFTEKENKAQSYIMREM